MSQNKSLNFFEVVIAVIYGNFIFKFFDNNKEVFEGYSLIVWVLIALYIAGSVIISQWREKQSWKKHDREELEFVRSQGYESWAEYMVDHGDGEDVRKSWKSEAEKAKAKR